MIRGRAAAGPHFHAVVTLGACGAAGVPAHFAGAGIKPRAALGVPWYDFEPRAPDCGPPVLGWLAKLHDRHVTMVTAAAPELAALLQWLAPVLGAQSGNVDVDGLPLIEVAAPGPGRADLVLILSGDGGWAALDKGLAREFVHHGFAVVGWDSLSYYWTPRTPAGAAEDLARILDHYWPDGHGGRLLIVGYSFGANVLPFLLTRLPEAYRRRVDLAVFLGPSVRASFEFHLRAWLNAAADTGLPTAPELARLRDVPRLCIAGRADTEAACPPLAAPSATLRVAGDHHFGSDYAGLADTILGRLVPAS